MNNAMDQAVSRYRAVDAPTDFYVMLQGVGAVGSHVAYLLSRFSVRMGYVDPDVVEEGNLGVQFFTAAHVGVPKVDAVSEVCGLVGQRRCSYEARPRASMSAIDYAYDLDYISPCTSSNSAYVVAVDSIAARQDMAATAKRLEYVGLYVDVRTGFDFIDLYAFKGSPEAYDEYMRTLPASDDEVPNEPCGQHMSPVVAVTAAGLAAQTVVNYWRGIVPQPHLAIDMKGMVGFGALRR